jgi:hypothetical protein
MSLDVYILVMPHGEETEREQKSHCDDCPSFVAHQSSQSQLTRRANYRWPGTIIMSCNDLVARLLMRSIYLQQWYHELVVKHF